jgi:hypothetical protein
VAESDLVKANHALLVLGQARLSRSEAAALMLEELFNSESEPFAVTPEVEGDYRAAWAAMAHLRGGSFGIKLLKRSRNGKHGLKTADKGRAALKLPIAPPSPRSYRADPQGMKIATSVYLQCCNNRGNISTAMTFGLQGPGRRGGSVKGSTRAIAISKGAVSASTRVRRSLSILRQPKTTPTHELESYMRCKSCLELQRRTYKAQPSRRASAKQAFGQRSP